MDVWKTTDLAEDYAGHVAEDSVSVGTIMLLFPALSST